MTDSPLEDAEKALRSDAVPVDFVLDEYGPAIVRSGNLAGLRDLLDSNELAGLEVLANWIRRADLEANGRPDSQPLTESVDAGGELGLIDAVDLLADPESLHRPDEVVPGIAFRRSLTLLSGRPNVSGKTSLLVTGGAAVASGERFLGSRAPEGTVLWIMAEGDERHIGRYLAQIEADPPRGRFGILRSGSEPLNELERAVSGFDPDLVVIDSLGTWIAPLDVDMYTEEVVVPLRRVERVARSGPAVVVIHHPRKADGDPAGSHKIQAVPDLVRSVEVGDRQRERVMGGHGRWRLPEVRWRMRVTGQHPEIPDLKTVRFRVIDSDRDLEAKILDFLEVQSGASKSAVRANVNARSTAVDQALDALVEKGLVNRDKSGQAYAHRIAENPPGHATDTVRTGPGHGGRASDGDTVSERVPPSLGEGDPRTRSPEPPGPDTEDEDDPEGAIERKRGEDRSECVECGSGGVPAGSDLCVHCTLDREGVSSP